MKNVLRMCALGALSLVATTAFAATIVVDPDNLGGWGFLQEAPTGSGAFVAGPAGGLGAGSANLVVDSTGGEIIGKAAYAGMRLDEFTDLEYSTYRTSGGPALAIALQLNFDGDVTDLNDAWQGRLVYEPYHTQTVSTGVWETWDALDDSAGSGTGNWWFSNGTHAANSGCAMATPCTWAEVLAAFPDGGVHKTFGAVVLKAGGGWTGGFDGNVDVLVVNDDTYDFEPDTDADDDGVEDGDDLCEDTEADVITGTLGVNRWMWDGNSWEVGKTKKGTWNGKTFDISDIFGCGCIQILEMVSGEVGGDFGGHYKYGCSQSVLEDFALDYEDGEIDGRQFIETVEVDSANIDGEDSVNALLSGKQYYFDASGTWTNRPGETVDSKFVTMDGWGSWTDAPDGGYPDDLLELQVADAFVDWGAFDSGHQYSLLYAPLVDGILNFRVFDGDVGTNTPNPGWYGDNIGVLSVDIARKLY